MNSLISIIIPIYNVEKYLEKCICSVLNQTYQNLEIILVNDGSTDKSREICEKYRKKDARIRLVNKSNGGLSDARNAGMDAASGDYFYFLDSDDFIEPALIETLYQKLTKEQADMVIFNFTKVTETGELAGKSNFLPGTYDLTASSSKFDYLLHIYLEYKNGWEAWDRIYRADIIRTHNLRYINNSIIFAEDLCFNFYYLMHANRVITIEASLLNYLVRSGSIMHQDFDDIGLSCIITLSKLLYDYSAVSDSGETIKNGFYLLFCLILDNHCKEISQSKLKYYLQNVYYKEFLKIMLIEILSHPVSLLSAFGAHRGLKFWKRAAFCLLSMSPFQSNHYLLEKHVKYKMPFLNRKKKLFLFGTEDFGNLGDNQIAISELEFLKSYFYEYTIFELPASKYRFYIAQLEKYVNKNDPIFLTGGGNLGDQYPFAENIRRDAIRRFPHNKILIFPQTIDFAANQKGQEELALSKAVYDAHPQLFLCTREKKSFAFAKEVFQCQVLLMPDIVLFSNYSFFTLERTGLLFNLRKDKESILSENTRQDLIENAKKAGCPVKFIEHQLDHDISAGSRSGYLKAAREAYAASRLVITDRLHGMIFSVITGTPCICMNNCNAKIEGVYEWLKNISYIKFIQSPEDLPAAMQELLERKPSFYNHKKLLSNFKKIIEIMQETSSS